MAIPTEPHWKTLKKLSKIDRHFIIKRTIKDRKFSFVSTISSIIFMPSPFIAFIVVFLILQDERYVVYPMVLLLLELVWFPLYTICERILLRRLKYNINKYFPEVLDEKDFDAWDQLFYGGSSNLNNERTCGQKLHSNSFYDNSGNYPGSIGRISKGY